jgi:hypothetical protein
MKYRTKVITTPHFLKYKNITKDMVKPLERIETIPLVPAWKLSKSQTRLRHEAAGS